MRAIRAIEDSDVCLFMIDANEGLQAPIFAINLFGSESRKRNNESKNKNICIDSI